MYKSYKKNWIQGIFILLIITLITAGLAYDGKAQSQITETSTIAANMETAQQPTPQTEQPTTVIIQQPNVSETSTPQPQQKPAPAIKGLALHIDSIGLHISLGKTGLDKNRRLMVPANANNAALYAAGPQPGAAGTALITGHYDSNGGRAGVFYNLEKVSIGDEIRVNRADGKVAVYRVVKSDSYRQDNTFPWSKVFSKTGASGLRIITCDGKFNPATGKYSHNLVVYASLIKVV